LPTGLEYWRNAAREEVDVAAVARLTDDPRYSAVLRQAITGGLAFNDAEPELNATFQDIGTAGLATLALYLDANGGITHRRLAEISNTSTILSRGRASAILGMLRFRGLATPERHAPRGAQIRYRMSPGIPHFFTTRIGIEFKALSLVEPSVNALLEIWEKPGTLHTYVASFGNDLVNAGRKPVADLETITDVGGRRGGFHILFDMLMRADKGDMFPSLAPFEVSISEMARRFSVSRAHVRRVVARTEALGFLVRDKDTFQFQPVLQSKLRRYIATVHVALMACAHDVLQPPDKTAP